MNRHAASTLLPLAMLLVSPFSAAATPDAALLDTRLEAASGRFSGVLGVQGREDPVPRWSVAGEAGAGHAHAADLAYPVASVTKPVVAVAVLRLEEQGRLRLEDRLDRHWPAAAGHPAGAVSIAQLLTHQSGVPSVLQTGHGLDTTLDESQWPLATTASAVLAQVLPMPLRFEPGERYEYSNSGYLLLGEVIGAVTGKPVEEAVIELALAPAGVARQACFCDDLPGHGDAHGQEWQPEGDTSGARRMHPTRSGAAGALRITPRALLAWGRALVDGHILEPSTLARMWAAGKPTRRSGETMAMGWLVRDGERGLVLHDGTLPGITATLAITPDTGRVAVGVLAPTLPMAQITRSETYLRERTAGLATGHRPSAIPALGPQPVAAFDGEYALPDGGVLQVRRVAQGWQLELDGGTPLALAQSVQLTDPDSRRALDAMQAWAAGGQVALRPYLSATLREALPDGALDGAWTDWVARLGAYSGTHAYARAADGGNVRVRLRFERGNVDIALNLGDDRAIEGLQLRGESGPGLPSSVTAPVTADGTLWLDGYRHDLDPVTLHPHVEDGHMAGWWIGQAGLADAYIPRIAPGAK